jgi:hypothetical protein
MSSFKGDSYYEAHVDDAYDPEHRESLEEDCAESEIPQHMKRQRAQWVHQHMDVLTDLYECFKGSGTVLFGKSFYQLGTIDQFFNFVFKYTMPGGTN